MKKTIDRQINNYIRRIDRDYSLRRISPLLFESIKEFILRDGKRVRPILFAMGYLGYSKKPAAGLYQSAVSIELLHDFMLIHDDILDKSDTRRGKPSFHALLNTYLKTKRAVKFSGEDLALVAGDVLYAMAIDAFLSIKEDPLRKEQALKQLIKAALYTGSGEFIELVYGIKDIARLRKEDIYKVYDLKTANYTFASPLTIGARLAGVKNREAEMIFSFGTYLGRAFQIKDDIIGIFSEQRETGKSNLTDLQEAKKTILIWYAYHLGTKTQQAMINYVFAKKKVTRKDLKNIQEIIISTGALKRVHNEIRILVALSLRRLDKLKILPRYKTILRDYSRKILAV